VGNPVFRFRLSHTPKTSVSTGITIPPNSDGENIAGSGDDWTTGNNPAVTVSGSIGSRQSDIWANDYGFGTGLSYTINYAIDYNINGNVISTTVNFVVLDVANNILVTDGKSIVSTGSGTLNESSTFTAPGGAVKFGFYIVIVNALSNAGSSFDINGITGSVATIGESGSPSSVTITEPMGWKDSKLKMERHPDFHSLVEYFETGLVYYGSNGVDNGGINFLKAKEQEYGFDTTIEETVEADIDGDGVFEENIFTGLKDLTALQEIPDNKMEVPTIRNDLWSKFISRLDTPVDLRSTTTLDGDPVTPVPVVDVNLPSQTIRKNYSGYLSEGVTIYEDDILINEYIQYDFDKEDLSEIKEKYHLYVASNPEIPVDLVEAKETGIYTIDLRIEMSIKNHGGGTISACAGAFITDPTSAYMDVYIKFSDTAIQLSKTNFIGQSTVYSYSGQVELKVGDQIRIYAKVTSVAWKLSNSVDSILVYGKNNSSVAIETGNFSFNGVSCVLDSVEREDRSFTIPSGSTNPTYLTISADTIYPDTEAEGFYLHDAFLGVIERIVGENVGYSEILGRIDTNMRQYAANGCFSKNVLLRGLQIRGYSLTEKPFSVSFNQLWKGANPIFNLGLGYETIANTEYIRIEDKAYFYDNDVSINISNVRQMTRDYDPDSIFNKIEVGYNRWESEDITGIDDPQTKRTYATRITKAKNSLNINSDFVAASSAIETTRRQTIEKSKDYKYDNEIFIIAVNDNDVSPDRYTPELDENFNSITGLVNYPTRYNNILTPMRNLLRWANVWNGCLQKYQNSFIKFVSGEGNFDMSSDYSCSTGYQCLGVLCDNLSEKQDIPLGPPSNYGNVFGYLHRPELFTIDIINFTWDDYRAIRESRSNSIRISQTNTDHKRFKIKELIYEICKGKARIVAWPYDEFVMSVVETSMPERACIDDSSLQICVGLPEFDEDYQNVIDTGLSLGYRLPSCDQRVLQNQLVLDLKAAGIWDELDLLYVFATDGDENYATINWKAPANFRCTRVNSPAHIANVGVQGNATNSYLDTNWAPGINATHLTLNSASAFCYINNDTVSSISRYQWGVDNNAAAVITLCVKATTTAHRFGVNSSNADLTTGTINSMGLHQTQRTASNEMRLFKNGVQVGSTLTTASSNVPPSAKLSICGFNVNGTTTAFSEAQIGIFGIGSSLSGKESALNTVWNDYFTSL
jgi:hypothetical protein